MSSTVEKRSRTGPQTLSPLGQLTRNSVRLLLFLFSHGPLARLRSRLPLEGALCCKQFKILIRIGPYATEQLFARSLQTAADSTLDSTQLFQQVPEDASTPFSVKLHEDSFELITPTPLPLTSRSPKKASSKCTRTWSRCVASEQSADALYKSKLIRGFLSSCHWPGAFYILYINFSSRVIYLTVCPRPTFFFLLRSRFSRSGVCYNQGRQGYHVLPLPSFCCPPWWNNHRCHR
jgi:hypothetical protein